jgi:hypothetical protein
LEILGKVLARVLEFFDNAAAREMTLGDEGWQDGEGVLRKGVFIG